MNNKLNELNEREQEEVVGGRKIVNLNKESKWDPLQDGYTQKRAEWKSDEARKSQIREMVKIFDSSPAHNLAIGECPGCGCLVNSIGNVCAECRKQANS